MNALRIGFIGAGANTRKFHLPGFLSIHGVEPIVVCNRSRESSEAIAREFGIKRTADDWRSVIEDPDVDAVCIGTWPYLHAAATIAALEAGKHVLTEARMAMDASEAEAMLEASRRHSECVAQVVPAPFTFRWDATIQKMVRSQAFGDLREVCVSHTTGVSARADSPATWRLRSELSGRNTMTMGIYHEIILRWFECDPQWVLADACIHTSERVGDDRTGMVRVDVPDTLSVLGRFHGGARLVYHFSGIESGRGRNEIIINGSAQTLRLDLREGKLWCAASGESDEEEVTIAPEHAGRWDVENEFVQSIRNGAPVLRTSFEDGVRYMRFTDAVWDSWNGYGIKVALPPRRQDH